MSKLIFDGALHKITLFDSKDNEVGAWDAYNNTDSKSKIDYLHNRTYSFTDCVAPHRHTGARAKEDTKNGSYGSYGIVRFEVGNGHSGVGVHSGRANHPRLPGPKHWTRGCIRTTDDAMKSITQQMSTDSLMTIEVINNSLAVSKQHM